MEKKKEATQNLTGGDINCDMSYNKDRHSTNATYNNID